MIKYNNNTINDWNFGTSNLIKVYRNNAIVFYKVSGESPTPVQEPCFAVVDDISQYTDREFDDVFDNATEKWYKLNNLNNYEEYGVYGSGRTSCEGSSRLPLGYTEVEYIENTGTSTSNGAYLNLGLPLYNTIGNSFVITSRLKSEYYSASGYDDLETIINSESVSSPYYGFAYRYEHSTHNVGLTTNPSNHATLSTTANTDGTTSLTISCNSTSVTDQVPLGLFASYNANYNTPYRFAKATIYSFTVVKNGTTVRDLVPCKRDSDDKYGMYDIVNDVFYISPNNVDFIGGEPITPTVCVTTYEGKLTIDDGYEYQYTNGSWVNVGEVSGSSITIKSPEYIEKDSSHSGKINLDYVWKTNSKMQFKFYSTNNGGGSMIGEDRMPDNNDCRMFFASSTAYFDWGSSRISWSSNGRVNTLYEYEYGNYYIKNMVTSESRTSSTISTNRTNPLYLGTSINDRFRTYYLKFYDGGTLVKDFIPWTDMNGNYGLFDKVSLSVYNVVSGSLTGSSNVTDVEVGGGYTYPIYYDEIQDPPDNVPFVSMSEAQEYECPWWGMTGIIANADYLFCDSNEWLTKYSYQEVSGYICDSGNKYKRLQEFERNADGTMSSVGYVKGDLIEIASPDCPQCTVNFCGVAANGNDVIINNGTTTLSSSNWSSPYPVEGIVGTATITIGMYCFQSIKTTLSALTIGNTVATIEHEAFMETSLLTTLTIPASVTQIDFWAFTRCNGLQEVIFEGTTPPTFTNQHDGVFHDYCPPVIYVPDSAVSAYRAIEGSVWTNQTFDVNTRIKGISERS